MATEHGANAKAASHEPENRPVDFQALAICGFMAAEHGREDKAPLEARQSPEVPSAAPTGEPTLPRPAEVRDGVMPQPQAEAAALKREAVAVGHQVAEAYPDDALAYALLGSAYYNTGQAELATRHLKRCIELNPGQAEAYGVLARVAYDRGELEETVRLCQEALKRGPANPDVLNRLGQALMDQGQTAESVRILEQAVRLPGPAGQSYYLLGQANLQAGNHAAAKECFLKATALVPDHTQAYFGLYTACVRLGQTEEAARYRDRFQKLEAADRQTLTDRSAQQDTLTGLPMVRETVARTFFGAAQIYRAHGQTERAAGLLRKSVALDADNPMYRAALEAHYVQGKAVAEGVAVFEQLVAEQPGNSLNHFFLGRLYGRLEQFEPAERAYRKVQELAPQWPEGYRALAELYLRAKRQPAEAAALARKTIELEPSGPHYYLLAVACSRTGDRAGAVAAMKQAVALSPDEKRYQELLEQMQQPPKP
jgi:tetratricopeptide (TPR) repeat protein